MDRRKFIALMSSGVAATNLHPAVSFAEKPSTRPNFLFMIADDLTYRTIHSLNNSEVHTPNLDRLTASGCSFTHCFH
jgi:choline-sulfatase